MNALDRRAYEGRKHRELVWKLFGEINASMRSLRTELERRQPKNRAMRELRRE